MNTNLRSKLTIVAAVLIVALVAILVITPSGSAKKGNSPYVGMGDVRRFEAQQAAQDSGKLFSNHPYIGMGDLRYFERLQETGGNPGELFSDHPYIGMGDLRYFESLQEKGFPENADVAAP